MVESDVQAPGICHYHWMVTGVPVCLWVLYLAQVMGREAGENEQGLLDCSLVEITTFKCQGTLCLVLCFSGLVNVAGRLLKRGTLQLYPY